MGWLQEFKTFIQRGNVIDLAVAVIIGAAFGKIVNSLVTDVLTPILGIASQGGDIFSWLDIPLYEGAKIKLGAFLQSVLNFLIISVCVFLIVKGVNALKLEKLLARDPKPSELTGEEKLLTEIRDLLKAQQPRPALDETGAVRNVESGAISPPAPGGADANRQSHG